MKKSKMRFFSIVTIILFVGYLYFATDNAKTNSEEEQYKILTDAIIHSSVQCYAIEGYYPPNVEYLEENYGLLVDHNKYVVSYSIFASNIMPDVEVFIK